MYLARIGAVVASLALLACVPVSANEKSITGGAYQIDGLSGTIGKTLFNGTIRLKVSEVRDATPSDHPDSLYPNASQKAMVVSAIVHNGLHVPFMGVVTYTLADKHDVTINVPVIAIKPDAALDLQQASAAKQHMVFLTDKDFKPVKLIVNCDGCAMKFEAFRIALVP